MINELSSGVLYYSSSSAAQGLAASPCRFSWGNRQAEGRSQKYAFPRDRLGSWETRDEVWSTPYICTVVVYILFVQYSSMVQPQSYATMTTIDHFNRYRSMYSRHAGITLYSSGFTPVRILFAITVKNNKVKSTKTQGLTPLQSFHKSNSHPVP